MIRNEIDYDKYKGEETSRRVRRRDKSTSDKSKKASKKRRSFKLTSIRLGSFTESINELRKNKTLRNKILFTLLIIIMYRALASIPLPGIDMEVYDQFLGQSSASETSYFFLIFTGGLLETPSVVGLGIAAYINASIIMQLLTPVIPKLTELQKEGARGTQVINQWTRYITLPLAFLYSVVYILFLSQRDLNDTSGTGTITENPAFLIPRADGADWPTITKVLFMAIILTAGSMLIMWLAEAITENGIGNGSSLIITIGIVASLPTLIRQDFSRIDFGNVIESVLNGNFSVLQDPIFISLVGIVIGAIAIIAAIVFANESIRKIKIQYSRRANATAGADDSHLPIKLTLTGVLPIIFASALLSVPQLIIPFIQNVIEDTNSRLYQLTVDIQDSFLFATSDAVVNADDIWYGLVYFILIVLFGIFYAFIALKPEDTAENLQKSSAFIPGIRPGKSTEKYISRVLSRIGFAGALFLGLVALIPILARNVVESASGVNMLILSGVGGTSILIVVSVVIDTYRQYQSFKVSRSYEEFV